MSQETLKNLKEMAAAKKESKGSIELNVVDFRLLVDAASALHAGEADEPLAAWQKAAAELEGYVGTLTLQLPSFVDLAERAVPSEKLAAEKKPVAAPKPDEEKKPTDVPKPPTK